MQNRTKREGDGEGTSIKSTPKNHAVCVPDLSSEEGWEPGGGSPDRVGEKDKLAIVRPKNVPKASEITEMLS